MSLAWSRKRKTKIRKRNIASFFRIRKEFTNTLDYIEASEPLRKRLKLGVCIGPACSDAMMSTIPETVQKHLHRDLKAYHSDIMNIDPAPSTSRKY